VLLAKQYRRRTLCARQRRPRSIRTAQPGALHREPGSDAGELERGPAHNAVRGIPALLSRCVREGIHARSLHQLCDVVVGVPFLRESNMEASGAAIAKTVTVPTAERSQLWS